MTKKKMGGLGKLSQFSGIKHSSEEVRSQVEETPNPPIPNLKPPRRSLRQEQRQVQNEEKLVTVNIKITKAQKDWLAETASQVRDNNTEPVPPAYRVYPQHLIGVAIELLQAAEVDWSQVKNL